MEESGSGDGNALDPIDGKKDSYFALSLGVEEIATSERLRRIAFFPPRLCSPGSDAYASFPEMELGEENIGSRLVDLPQLEREGEIK